ncbi:MAG: ATP-binding protein [Nitrososphaeraceae archaeon]
MNQTENYNNNNNILPVFTDFDGKFKGRLSAVIPARINNTSENAPISAKYDCRIKVEYHKEIMSLLEEGMIIAVKNFKSKFNNQQTITNCFSLFVISRIWPDHYGMRGLSDSTYYPMQFEVIEQSVEDWATDDKSTMMIQISAIPINYDLLVNYTDDGEIKCEYVKGFSYPIIGDTVFLLNAKTVSQMYNQKVMKKMNWDANNNNCTNSEGPELGIIKMFDNSPEKIPIYVHLDNLVRYHFGIFAFTGGGKSNLLSNLLRKILLHTKDTKILLFDISCEYPFLLADLFADTSIESKIILERPVNDAEQFYVSVVKPREFEEDERAKKVLVKVFERGIATHFVKPSSVTPTCKEILKELEDLKNESTGKPHYLDAINQIYTKLFECMTQNNLNESSFIDENFVQILSISAIETMKTFKVSDKAGLYAWASSRDTLRGRLQQKKNYDKSNIKNDYDGVTIDQIIKILEGNTRLTCISISDPYTIKDIAITLSRELLYKRKRQFKVRPYILFVFDEAQEFVQDLSNSRGIDKECSIEVETLLRQGRKYGLGGCIATQRIAYLNTSALQQLHTYFVGTLPRPYDRNVVSNTFNIDNQILEKTLEFAPGEWLLSSYIATGIENVPIFIRAENSEKKIESFIEKQ